MNIAPIIEPKIEPKPETRTYIKVRLHGKCPETDSPLIWRGEVYEEVTIETLKAMWQAREPKFPFFKVRLFFSNGMDAQNDMKIGSCIEYAHDDHINLNVRYLHMTEEEEEAYFRVMRGSAEPVPSEYENDANNLYELVDQFTRTGVKVAYIEERPLTPTITKSIMRKASESFQPTDVTESYLRGLEKRRQKYYANNPPPPSTSPKNAPSPPSVNGSVAPANGPTANNAAVPPQQNVAPTPVSPPQDPSPEVGDGGVPSASNAIRAAAPPPSDSPAEQENPAPRDNAEDAGPSSSNVNPATLHRSPSPVNTAAHEIPLQNPAPRENAENAGPSSSNSNTAPRENAEDAGPSSSNAAPARPATAPRPTQTIARTSSFQASAPRPTTAPRPTQVTARSFQFRAPFPTNITLNSAQINIVRRMQGASTSTAAPPQRSFQIFPPPAQQQPNPPRQREQTVHRVPNALATFDTSHQIAQMTPPPPPWFPVKIVQRPIAKAVRKKTEDEGSVAMCSDGFPKHWRSAHIPMDADEQLETKFGRYPRPRGSKRTAPKPTTSSQPATSQPNSSDTSSSDSENEPDFEPQDFVSPQELLGAIRRSRGPVESWEQAVAKRYEALGEENFTALLKKKRLDFNNCRRFQCAAEMFAEKQEQLAGSHLELDVEVYEMELMRQSNWKPVLNIHLVHRCFHNAVELIAWARRFHLRDATVLLQMSLAQLAQWVKFLDDPMLRAILERKTIGQFELLTSLAEPDVVDSRLPDFFAGGQKAVLVELRRRRAERLQALPLRTKNFVDRPPREMRQWLVSWQETPTASKKYTPDTPEYFTALKRVVAEYRENARQLQIEPSRFLEPHFEELPATGQRLSFEHYLRALAKKKIHEAGIVVPRISGAAQEILFGCIKDGQKIVEEDTSKRMAECFNRTDVNGVWMPRN